MGSPTSGGWAGGCPTDERAQSASIAELLAELESEAELYRVLWVVAAGRNRYEDLLSLCTATAVSRAITSALIVEPLDDDLLPPYHLTDAGRDLLVRWRRKVCDHLDVNGFLAVWEAVTQR